MKNKKKCFFVMGSYRSGTSMVSRMLVALGLDCGPEAGLFPPTDWNPGGYIQRPDITALNTYLINRSGGNLFNPGSPEKIDATIFPKDFNYIDLEWASGSKDILIKDPRLSFTAKAWIEKSPLKNKFEFSFVFVTRDELQIASSALSHYDVKNYCGPNVRTALEMINRYTRGAKWQIDNSNATNIIVNYEKLLKNPDEMVRSSAKFVGCDNEEKIIQAIGSLSHGKSLLSSKRNRPK